VAGLVSDQLEHDQAQVALFEEAAPAVAAMVMATATTGILAMAAARMGTAMTVVTALAAGVLVRMMSKHVFFRSYFVISK
jgi:hypothetical protein